MLTAMMGNWMLSSGSIGITQLSASATGMSFPFLYTTLKGRYGNDLTISLCTLGLPQKKRNSMKRQITIIMMRIIEVIAETAHHIGVNKVAENPIEDPNKGEGGNKIITGANIKATADNLTHLWSWPWW